MTAFLPQPLRMRDERTGDVIELPPPDFFGRGTVIFNGRIVERILYSDIHHTVTFEDGRRMQSGDEFANYIVSQIERGAYREAQQ